MDWTTIPQVAQWAGGHFSGMSSAKIGRVVTDSRKVEPGDLFVALKGERFDAHDFLAEVAERGATGALVERGVGVRKEGFPVIEVEDTLKGLQRLASAYRKTLRARVVGITGSSGKTSTKDFTFAVVSQMGRGWCTQGNLNNHIGVPLTLLAGGGMDEMGVVEMGMNHAGEIEPLARMAMPEVGIVTNVGVAHIENLGSREAIAVEKGALARALPETGTVVLSAVDDFTPLISSMTRARVLTAGIGCGDVQAVDLFPGDGCTRFGLVHEGERVEVELGVPGSHMVLNAALAAAAGLALGGSLEMAAHGLRDLAITHGRLESKRVGGIRFLDDTYNANPDSMVAALATLAQWPVQGRRIAVLGRMGELGNFSEEGHRRVGKAAGFYAADWVVTLGEEARWIAEEARASGVLEVDHCEEVEVIGRLLKEKVTPEDLVLVKGSRSARMERVIQEVAKL
jgi:UDP-N-acetylmuramoyl-tripeptide--D-alanyl-D-alanine ligase